MRSGDYRDHRSDDLRCVDRRRRAWGWRLVPFLVALAVFGAWLDRVDEPFTGDEPHYLVVADSIVEHHTLDLRTAYTEARHREPTRDLTPDHGVDARGDGYLAPIQAVGLPVLLAPVREVTRSLLAVRVFMCTLTALLLALLYEVMRNVAPRRRAVRAAVWGGLLASTVMLSYSHAIYPEVPGALLVTVALLVLTRAPTLPGACIGATAAALLPWFHTRFTAFAFALAVAFTLRAITAVPRDARTAYLAAVGVPLAASFGMLALLYLHIYGSPFPWAAYSTDAFPMPALTAQRRYRLAVGALLSPTEGLVPFAPVALLGLPALGHAARRCGRTGAALLVGIVAYLVLLLPVGLFGLDPPGRFAVVLVPFLAVSAVIALDAFEWVSWLLVPLIALTIVGSYSASRNFIALYVDPSTTAPVRAAIAILPWSDYTRGVDDGTLDTSEILVGTVVPHLDEESGPVVDTSARDEAIAAWRPLLLREAPYDVELEIEAQGRGGGPVATFEVRSGSSVLASSPVEPGSRRVELRVKVPGPDREIGFQLWSRGEGRVRVGPLHFRRTGRAEARDTLIREKVPVGVAWVSVVVAAWAAGAVGGRRRSGGSRGAHGETAPDDRAVTAPAGSARS